MKSIKNRINEEPEIYALKKGKQSVEFERRDFLKSLGLLTGAALAGCDAVDNREIAGVLSEPGIVPQTIGTNMCDSLFAHSGYVNSVCFSPTGKILASGSGDTFIKLWSGSNGNLIKTLKGHTGSVYAISFSPDGKLLASASEDNTIKLWSMPEGQIFRTLKGHSKTVASISFSPDGKMLASGGFDNVIKLWSVSDGKILKTIEGHANQVITLSFHPDGKILASASSDYRIKLWTISDGQLLKTIEGHTNNVQSVSFSPDGKLLASGSLDNTIKLWSIPDGNLFQTIDNPDNGINSVVFSPNGQYLFSGCNDGILIWSLPTGQIAKTLRGHSRNVLSLSLSPDFMKLVSGGSDKTIKLWKWNSIADIEFNGTVQRGLDNLVPPYVESGNFIAVNNSENIIQIVDLSKNAVKYSIKASSVIDAMAFDPEEQFLIIGKSQGYIRWWNLDNPGKKGKIKAHEGKIIGIVILNHNKRIVTAGSEGVIKIWSFPDMECITSLKNNIVKIDGITLKPDEATLACFNKNIIQLWSLENYSLIKEIKSPQGAIESVHFAPKSSKLLIRTTSGLSIHDYYLDEEVTGFKSTRIVSASISNDESSVAVLYTYGEIEVRDFKKLAVLKEIKPGTDNNQRIAFADNSNRMIVYTSGAIQIYRFTEYIDDVILGTCLFDKIELAEETKGVQYKVGSTTMTLPCGTPIPAGFVCTCNCVMVGSPKAYVPETRYNSGTYYYTQSYWYPN